MVDWKVSLRFRNLKNFPDAIPLPAIPREDLALSPSEFERKYHIRGYIEDGAFELFLTGVFYLPVRIKDSIANIRANGLRGLWQNACEKEKQFRQVLDKVEDRGFNDLNSKETTLFLEWLGADYNRGLAGQLSHFAKRIYQTSAFGIHNFLSRKN